MNKNLFNISGVIIYKYDFDNNDRMVRLISDQGMIYEIIIKNILISKKRDKMATEPLSYVSYSVYCNNNANYAKEIKTDYVLDNVWTEIKKISIAGYLLNILNKFNLATGISTNYYSLLNKTLRFLNDCNNYNEVLILVLYYFYMIIVKEGFKFSVKDQFLVYGDQKLEITLSIRQKKILLLLMDIDINALIKLQSKDRELLELLTILEKYLISVSEIDINRKLYFGEEIFDEFG